MKNWLEIIKRRRAELNLTQADMSDALGLDQSGYSRLEKGKSDITLKQLEIICFKLKLRAMLYIPLE